MAKLYSPSKKIKGPWLLDKNALEELNEIVEFANVELEKIRNEKINADALKDFEDKKYDSFEKAKAYALKYSYDIIRKNIILISNDESRLNDNSIKELLVDPKLKNFKPKELSIDIEYGKLNKFSFNVKQRFDGELEYEVISTKSEIEDEINYRIENWIDKYKPLLIQTMWLSFATYLAIFGCIIFFISALNIFSTYKPNSVQVYKNQIENLIETGINIENQFQALDLILKINSDYVPLDIKEETLISEPAKRVSIISLAFCLIGIFNPKTIIGVGKHKQTLKLYRRYMKFIVFVIPALFIYPYVVEIIKNWL